MPVHRLRLGNYYIFINFNNMDKINQLKAEAYDLLVKAELINNEMKAIQERLAAIAKEIQSLQKAKE